MNANSQNVSPWDFGDPVLVQIPSEDGFTTFSGAVVGIAEDGRIEVSHRGRSETVMCRPEWVYPEDYLEV